MTLTDSQQQIAASFRSWLDEKLAADERFESPVVDDRPDGSTLTSRYPIGRSLFVEVTVRPLLPQVRVGVVTDDRWRSEELEDLVEESGDTMGEFLEVPFSEAGLEWDEPPVEHFRADGKWFSFITPVDLDSIDDLGTEAMRTRISQMIEGYMNSYGQG